MKMTSRMAAPNFEDVAYLFAHRVGGVEGVAGDHPRRKALAQAIQLRQRQTIDFKRVRRWRAG